MNKFAILNNDVPVEAIEATSSLYLSVFKLVLYGMLSNDSTNANFDLSSKEVSLSLTAYYVKVKEIQKDFADFYRIKDIKKMDVELFGKSLINKKTDLAVINKIADFLVRSKIDLTKIKGNKNVHDIVNMTIYLTNTLMISSCEYSPDIVKMILQDDLINSPQWWVIAVKGNFSMKSIKHSINTVHNTADNSKKVKAYLVNGAAALCPTNLTLGFIIDILGKNRPLNKIMIPKINSTFSDVGLNINGVVQAKNFNSFDKYRLFYKSLVHLDLHIKAASVAGLTGFLNPYQFNHTYFFFWRYNAISLRNTVFSSAFIQQKVSSIDELMNKYILKGDK